MNDYNKAKIQRAKDLATKAHDGQFRKYSGEPYIVHPIQVHDLMCESLNTSRSYIKDGKILDPTLREIRQIPDWLYCAMECAAYLHDVLEDCPQITEQDIIDATDEQTLTLVKELTNPSKGSTAPRAVRKKMDRDHLEDVSWGAKFIKLCDRTINLRDFELCSDTNFLHLYATESKDLLQVLKGTDIVMEDAMANEIEIMFLRCPRKQ
jgi:(p)ppGpp synthase/HD superfamily hydrolase